MHAERDSDGEGDREREQERSGGLRPKKRRKRERSGTVASAGTDVLGGEGEERGRHYWLLLIISRYRRARQSPGQGDVIRLLVSAGRSFSRGSYTPGCIYVCMYVDVAWVRARVRDRGCVSYWRLRTLARMRAERPPLSHPITTPFPSPSQFDLIRCAATREKVNYAVNESIYIYIHSCIYVYVRVCISEKKDAYFLTSNIGDTDVYPT